MRRTRTINGRTQQILLHLAGCGVFLALPILISPETTSLHSFWSSPPTQREFISYVMVVAVFYLNFYGFIPRLYFQRRYVLFVLVNLLCFVPINFIPDMLVSRNNAPGNARSYQPGAPPDDLANAPDHAPPPASSSAQDPRPTARVPSPAQGPQPPASQGPPPDNHPAHPPGDADHPQPNASPAQGAPPDDLTNAPDHAPPPASSSAQDPRPTARVPSPAQGPPGDARNPQPGPSDAHPPPPHGRMPHPPFLMDLNQHIFLFLVVIFFALMLKIRERWKRTEEEKTNAELSYLKAQINPHFLFNTLNSIYSLALEKSDKTPAAIVQLSEMMRYVLHDAGRELVPLEKELHHIRNYIELQETRFGGSIRLAFAITGQSAPQSSEWKIAPLVLIPFIENAFKHGVNAEEDSDIRIGIDLREKELHLHVFNNKVTVEPSAGHHSGLGIANTRQRLQHLYPGRHTLEIKDNKNDFSVSLTLNLL